jgi:hypothetical protein
VTCSGSASDIRFVGVSSRRCDLYWYWRPSLSECLLSVLSPGHCDVHIFQAVEAATASQGVLVDLFQHIENFLRRLEIYTEVPLSTALTDIIVKVMAEVLSILAIATREIERGKTSELLSRIDDRCLLLLTHLCSEKFLNRLVKRLVGKTDIEDALGRLDKLTQEEVRTVAAQVLKVTQGVDDKMNKVLGSE